MELEKYNPNTDSWEVVEVKDEETQLIYDTMIAEIQVQEVLNILKENKVNREVE